MGNRESISTLPLKHYVCRTRLAGFAIDIDQASFGHQVVEIEAMSGPEAAEITEAGEGVAALAQALGVSKKGESGDPVKVCLGDSSPWGRACVRSISVENATSRYTLHDWVLSKIENIFGNADIFFTSEQRSRATTPKVNHIILGLTSRTHLEI